jgi:RNA polymerase sigma-70 factor (ECF subfamily)
VGGWLFRILGHAAVDRSRRGGREVGADDALMDAVEAPARGPEERLLAEEVGDAVRRALSAMPSGRKREVFRLRFVEGLPLHEIADRLGVHSGTVKVHLFRASRELRQSLRAWGSEG